jgi:hypothetical protein
VTFLTTRIFRTAQLALFALLPPKAAGSAAAKSVAATPPEVDGALRCAPRQIRGGMGRLLDGQGELRLFFPECLGIAAPVLLFRLKREGFSRCVVEATNRGLFLRGRR